MSNTKQQLYTQTISQFTKDYLKEALQECSKCWDTSMSDKCSANCDKPYMLFLQSKRVAVSKLNNCLSQSQGIQKNTDSCYSSAHKDLISLDNFIKRTFALREVENTSK